jgi:hypothetical protein
MSETEDFIEEEFLETEQEAAVEAAHEREDEPYGDADHHAESKHPDISPGLQAILDSVGGEPEDWESVYQGEGYTFNGEHIIDPQGKEWVNDDRDLHASMIAEWREGESNVFQLPDYREETEHGEALYVTQLVLGGKGDVTYEIHKHEIIYPRDEEEARSADVVNDARERAPVSFDPFFNDTEREEPERDPLAAMAEAAAEASKVEEQDDDLGLADRDVYYESAPMTQKDEREEIAAVRTEEEIPNTWLTDLLEEEKDRDQAAAAELSPHPVPIEALKDNAPIEERRETLGHGSVARASNPLPFERSERGARTISRQNGIVMERLERAA